MKIVHWTLGPTQYTRRDDGKEMWAAKIACAGQTAQIPKGHDQNSNILKVTCRYCLEALVEMRERDIRWAKDLLKEIKEQPKPKLRYTLRAIMNKFKEGKVDREILDRILRQ